MLERESERGSQSLQPSPVHMHPHKKKINQKKSLIQTSYNFYHVVHKDLLSI